MINYDLKTVSHRVIQAKICLIINDTFIKTYASEIPIMRIKFFDILIRLSLRFLLKKQYLFFQLNIPI